MSAVQKRRAPAPVVRRIPDAQGKLVTYLCLTELETLLGISASTISKWVGVGAVRSVGLLKGQRHASVLDATILATLPVAETLKMGIRRTPAPAYQAYRERFLSDQETTRKTAERHRIEWSTFDLEYLQTSYEAGVPLNEIAKDLGRTFAAVVAAIQRLRADGNISPCRNPHPADALRLLTEEERGMLEDN